MKNKHFSQVKLIPTSLFLGAASGIIVWVFLKVLALGTELLWEKISGIWSSPVYTVIVCTVGGLLVGLYRKRFGDYPEEMMVVLKKVKTEKYYDYTILPALLGAAFLPLIFGGSVGPEAALVGIITALCYWVAASLKKAAKQERLSKRTKEITYSLAIVAGLGSYVGLSQIFGAAMSGFPSFELALPHGIDFPLAIVYILAGCLLAKFYELTHHGCHTAAVKLPPILRETVAGLCLGIAATFVPQIMFSGEEELHHLMSDYIHYLPWALMGIALLKILLTNLCIQSGLKGGHFFPLIYAGVAFGYALAMLFFPEGAADHVIFAGAIVTAAMLGANMKQPAAVTLILLICFPFRMILWLAIGAFAGSAITSFGKEKKGLAWSLFHGKSSWLPWIDPPYIMLLDFYCPLSG